MKSLLAAIIGISLTIFSFTSFATTNCKGDLNNDGKITTVDLSLMKQLMTGLTPAGINKSNGDMNGDGKISTVDLSMLKQAIVEKKKL
ncbi:MAG: dockerin type I repeat-containing protein [Oxalobacter formigenes]|nr:dockerin type I repeat-containing protein [Oxalobacter formigenes]